VKSKKSRIWVKPIRVHVSPWKSSTQEHGLHLQNFLISGDRKAEGKVNQGGNSASEGAISTKNLLIAMMMFQLKNVGQV